MDASHTIRKYFLATTVTLYHLEQLPTDEGTKALLTIMIRGSAFVGKFNERENNFKKKATLQSMNPVKCVESTYRLPLKFKNKRFISDWNELGEVTSPVKDKHGQWLGTEVKPKQLKELLLQIVSPMPEVLTLS